MHENKRAPVAVDEDRQSEHVIEDVGTVAQELKPAATGLPIVITTTLLFIIQIIQPYSARGHNTHARQETGHEWPRVPRYRIH